MTAGSRYEVLIVEDDQFAADLAARWLAPAGFAITIENSGRSAESRLSGDHHFDLVILDLGLPDLDGSELLRRVRATGSSMGIIVVTGRGDEPDRIRGLREGADDYIVKPFSPGELLARAEAVLRRTSAERRGMLVLGDLVVDLDARAVRVQDKTVELTRTEFDLLAELAQNVGKVCTRAALLSAVWRVTPSPTAYALLNEYVSRLRKLCGRERISTVRGVGYRLDA
ncbi:MAG: response regulator transcription factor [Acidimicrobiia bacterium]